MQKKTEAEIQKARLDELAEMPVATHGAEWAAMRDRMARESSFMRSMNWLSAWAIVLSGIGFIIALKLLAEMI